MKVVSKWDGFDGVYVCLIFDEDEEVLGVVKGGGFGCYRMYDIIVFVKKK